MTLPAHLDPRRGDPRRARTSAHPPKRSTGRTIAIWSARSVGAIAAVTMLATAGWAAYLHDVAEANITRTDAIPTDGNSGAADVEEQSGTAMNILLVGLDSREGATEEELADALNTDDSEGGTGTDSMLLVHVPADGTGASVVSFPRDSYVDIPGHGKNKLNAAYVLGYSDTAADAPEPEKQAAGQQLLVQTISQLSGVSIDHYVQVSLIGFYRIANLVGGIDVNLCEPVKDDYSGINLPAGQQTISGDQIVSFVRQRHGLADYDLDRVKRQQYFIGAVARALMKPEIMLNPATQQDLITLISQNLTVDANLNLFEVAEQLQNLALGNLQFRTIPLGEPKYGQTSGGMDIVNVADETQMHQFFASLSAAEDQPSTPPSSSADPSTPPVDPATVTVDVLNGTPTARLATEASAALTTHGFLAGVVDGADREDYPTTTVYYPPGQQAQGAAVQALIPAAALTEDPTMQAGTVRVVLGADFTSVATGPPAAPPPNFTADDTTNCIH